MNPFDKSLTPSTDIALEFAIFNDGVPQSVYFGSHPEHEVLQSIPEDALDCFPPTAEEAAEMDEAEDFVETMAWLSYLEECDESSRNFEGLKKRWWSRRAARKIKWKMCKSRIATEVIWNIVVVL